MKEYIISKIPLKVKLIIAGIIGNVTVHIIFFIVVMITPLMILGIIDIEGISKGNSGSQSYSSASANRYWWPIGSEETTEKDGKIFATGEPVPTTITSKFGAKDIEAHANGHGAIDISGPYEYGEVNIIASKAGTVVYPTDESQTHFGTGKIGNDDGGGYGNYVIIEHSDGNYTLYAHMFEDTITVFEGDVVEQGQVIGKMGSSGSSDGLHLHFEIRKGGNSSANSVDPEDYVDIDNPRPSGSSGGSIPVVETAFTKTEFVAKMDDYCTRSGNKYFCDEWAARAEEVYDTSVKNEINPELVVATAGREQGWHNPGGANNNNYYGIGVANTGGSQSFSSFSAGIKAYADLLKQYRDPNGSYYSMIVKRNEEREAAGCDPAGHGPPDTYAGILSIYGWIGDYRYDPGDPSLGGCHYLNHYIYSDNYCSTVPTCTNYNNCPANSKTTACEQNDYTAYSLSETANRRYDVFGL